MVARSGMMCVIALDHHRRRRLRPLAGPDRLPADRGPGLRAGDGAAAGRRFARAHQARPRSGQRDRRQDSRRRPGDRDLRRVGARQQFDAGQCRRRLYRAQGLEPARQGRGPALAVPDLQPRVRRDQGGARHRLSAAADPGHRQCRRLAMQVAAARRQLRLGEAAEHHQHAGEGGADAERIAAGDELVPLQRAADEGGRRSRQGRDPAGLGRRRVLDAWPPISARATSTSSTSSAAPSRSTCRPIRSSACGPRTSSSCRSATSRADDAARHAGQDRSRRSVRRCSASTTSTRRRRCWVCRRPASARARR